MDPVKFEAWLSEIAHWHKPVPSDSTGRKGRLEPEARQTGPEIQQLKTCQVPCDWCENTCNSTDAKRWYREPTKTGTQWRGYCETCKKKYNPQTKQLGTQAFIKQGVRQASPGQRLGRKPKWWNVGNELAHPMDLDSQARRAEMLDRLESLRNNK